MRTCPSSLEKEESKRIVISERDSSFFFGFFFRGLEDRLAVCLFVVLFLRIFFGWFSLFSSEMEGGSSSVKSIISTGGLDFGILRGFGGW